MKPRPPIVVSEDGDLSFYASMVEAEQDLEAVDVRAGAYQVFDSYGYRLSPRIEERVKTSAIFGPALVEFVRLDAPASPEAVEEMLRSQILTFCSTLREPVMPPAGLALPELVRWAYTRFR